MRSFTDVPWFEESIVAAEKGSLEAQVAAMPEPAPQTASWLQDSDISFEGARAPEVSRPSPELSRPSPATRSASTPASSPSVSKPKPAPVAATAPKPASASSTSPKPSTAQRPTASTAQSSYAPAQAGEEKPGSTRAWLIAAAVVLVGIIVVIIATHKPAAPNLAPPPGSASQ
jgi:hypothetical protein